MKYVPGHRALVTFVEMRKVSREEGKDRAFGSCAPLFPGTGVRSTRASFHHRI